MESTSERRDGKTVLGESVLKFPGMTRKPGKHEAEDIQGWLELLNQGKRKQNIDVRCCKLARGQTNKNPGEDLSFLSRIPNNLCRVNQSNNQTDRHIMLTKPLGRSGKVRRLQQSDKDCQTRSHQNIRRWFRNAHHQLRKTARGSGTIDIIHLLEPCRRIKEVVIANGR